MQVKVSVGGMDATIEVQDVAEAVRLLKELSHEGAEAHMGDNEEQVAVKQPSFPKTENGSIRTPEEYTNEQVLGALLEMRGTKGAIVLKAICEAESGFATDGDLRNALDVEANENLGPHIANISKVLKKYGVPKEAVLLRNSKRGADRKVHYQYKVPGKTAAIIADIPDFDVIPDDPFAFDPYRDL